MRHVYCPPTALIVGAFLFLSCFTSAQAETPACHATNLLARLRSDNRQAYDEVIAEGRKIPNARGLFWKIDRKGRESSYLLGTVHVSDPQILAMADTVATVQRRSRVTILESDQLLDISRARALAFTKPDLFMMPAGKHIEDFLTDEQRQLVNTAFTAKGAPLSAVDTLRPWLAAGIMATPCQLLRAKNKLPVLDQQLALNAIGNKIPIKGLETLEEQYSALNRAPLDAQIKGLLRAVTFPGEADDIDETTVEIYRSGDLGPLQPLLKYLSKQDKAMDEDTYAKFEEAMIVSRNHVMAERLLPYLEDGNAFVAVGSLHLQGQEGLIQLLKAQGFKLSRVK